jgi:5'-nucleotidase
MAVNFENKLVIAISSRALFNLDESHHVYENQGLEAYRQYQIEHENDVLQPGEGFDFVTKLLNINQQLGNEKVEVILLSRNSADTGLRVFNSISHYQLNITRAAFCGGTSPYRYVSAFGSHLFLSTHNEDVRHALDNGVAAAILLPSTKPKDSSNELRIAFDGDAVLLDRKSVV